MTGGSRILFTGVASNPSRHFSALRSTGHSVDDATNPTFGAQVMALLRWSQPVSFMSTSCTTKSMSSSTSSCRTPSAVAHDRNASRNACAPSALDLFPTPTR